MGLGSLIFLTVSSCSQSTKHKNHIDYAVLDISSFDPHAVMTQKLGGPIGFDIEIEGYLKRVLLRLCTLSTFREADISIQIINSSEKFCLYFDGGKLLLSRGLLVSLSNEAELVASVAIAMMTKATLTKEKMKELNKLPEEITAKDFISLKELFKESHSKLELKRCEEILSSLGYSKSCLQTILKEADSTLIGLDEKIFQKADNSIVDSLSSGYSGEATYQKVIQPLKSLQDSYNLERKSLAHFEKNELHEAIMIINEAIIENPAEGHFYYTLSKFLVKQNSLDTAFKAIEQAIKLNSFNVAFYLHRAKLYELMSQTKEAVQDFKFANDLLLTR